MFDATERMKTFLGDAWAHEPVLIIEESDAFEAAITREERLVVHISTGCRKALERLQQPCTAAFDVETGLEWLILHELHHADLGHFEVLRGLPTLNLVVRFATPPIRLEAVSKEDWSKITPCLELQGDHEATEMMLGAFDKEDTHSLRRIAASISAVMVLIEKTDFECSSDKKTHPKAATRIFQLLGHLSEVPLVQAQFSHDTSLIPNEDELQAFAHDVTIPCFFDAIQLAKSAGAISIASDLGSLEDFFKDLEIAKLGDPSRYTELKTQGAQEWATLWPCNEALKPILGGHFTT